MILSVLKNPFILKFRKYWFYKISTNFLSFKKKLIFVCLSNLKKLKNHSYPITLVLQTLYFCLSPTQNFPPNAGMGLSQWRCFIATPPPQLLEQEDQLLHSPQPPSIASGFSPMVTHFWLTHHCGSKTYISIYS